MWAPVLKAVGKVAIDVGKQTLPIVALTIVETLNNHEKSKKRKKKHR